MVLEVDIRVKDNQLRFLVGDKVSGEVYLTLPHEVPINAIGLSFHCVGEVKWIEHPSSPYYLNGHVYYDDYNYYEEGLYLAESDVKVEQHAAYKKAVIPFSFVIPKDKNLPSTMLSNHGFIQYTIRTSIKLAKDDVKKYVKEIIVEAPFEDNLMITVGGTVEKSVLLHGGKVSLHASIDRKGYAPGETISVHVSVNNGTTARLIPRVSLHQVQIYMCGHRHKTIESVMSQEPITGAEIEPHNQSEERLKVAIPTNEALSIKSSVITVKYFVHVTLDIPHSFDLHVNLPVVLTAKAVIDKQQPLKPIKK